MNGLLDLIIHGEQCDAVRELGKHKDILTDTLTLDCSSQVHHCVCSSNFEYFRKPEHVLQCIQKGKCFHCQRYRAMQRQHETVTASTNLVLIAAALGKLEVLKVLHLNGGSLESKTGLFELHPIHLAIANGHFNIFCYLLTQKVNVNALALSHGTSYSPLMMAVIHKQEDMVRHLLLTKDINLQYRNSLSQSAVLFAVQNNSLEIMELLLDTEMAILDKMLDKNKLRKLHHPFATLEAVKQDNATLLERLLENRTKVNFVYRGYYTSTTSTTLAVVGNSHQCLRLLLRYGADYEFEEIEDITALGWAKRLKWTETLEVLGAEIFGPCSVHDGRTDDEGNQYMDTDSDCEYSCNCESKENFLSGLYRFPSGDDLPHPMIEIWSLVQWLDISDALRRLVSVGYDVNFQDNLGRTSLHMAVEEQNVPGLRALLELGADPNLQDACSATPLWHAVFWDKDSMIKELLFVNVNTECVAKEDAYRIGLPWASNDPSLEHDEIVFSETFASTLEVAARKNFSATVRLLLDTGYKTSLDEVQMLLSENCVKSNVRNILQDHISEPKSLFKISRNFIRKMVGAKIHNVVQQLDVPRRLKDCLLLRDVIDLKIEPTYIHL